MTPRETTSPRLGVSMLAPASAESRWNQLFKIGGAAAVAVLALMPIQAAVYMIWPPPTTVVAWFELFQRAPLLGLLNFDLLFVVTNALMIPIYLALYAALQRTNPALMLLGVALSLIGLAAYFPTNGAFEMLALSQQYAAAATDLERASAIGAGQSVVAAFAGMGFTVYYLLSAVAILLISTVMLRSPAFGRAAAYAGLTAGLFNLVPASAGQIGLVASFLGLIPTVVWLVLVGRTLLGLGRSPSPAA